MDALDARRPRQKMGKKEKIAYAKEKAMEELVQPPKNPPPAWLNDPSLLPKEAAGPQVNPYVLAVRAVGDTPREGEFHYLCLDDYILNGAHIMRLDGKTRQYYVDWHEQPLVVRGYISATADNIGGINWEDTLRRYRDGERCSDQTCPMCGHDPEGVDLLNLLREEAANHPDPHVQSALRKVEQTLLKYTGRQPDFDGGYT